MYFLPISVHTFEHIFIDIHISIFIYIYAGTFVLLKPVFPAVLYIIYFQTAWLQIIRKEILKQFISRTSVGTEFLEPR